MSQADSYIESSYFSGHAYTITKVIQVDNGVKLIRIRNPWGQVEWNGPWSDSSKEMQSLSEVEKVKHGIVKQKDGEFFMPVQDFQKHFESLEICNLTQDSLDYSDPR